VRIDLERVMTNDGIAVVEGRFVNPPEAPDHCPPGVALVMFGDDDRTWAMRLHLAPRAPRADEDRPNFSSLCRLSRVATVCTGTRTVRPDA